MEKRQESLIEHLEALRLTLIKCFAALGIGLLPMFLAAPDCIDLLIRIMTSGNSISLNYFSPMEVFVLQIKTAVVLDILICSPYIAKNIWEFVLPALHDNERRFIRSIVLSSCILFIFGALFCVFFILPLLVNFGLSFATPNIRAVFGISGIISTALWLSVVFGLMFQFPLITRSLIRSGIVSYRSVTGKRPHVIVGILLLAALLTPPDIVSQLMLAVPTYALFETSLFFSRPKQK